MKNAKIKKALAAGLSVALVAGLAVAGTVSYLQDTSEDAINTFSTNNVNVSLTETGNGQYNIIPGTSETKDPKVTVDNSVDAYVYVVVTDNTNGVVDYAIDLYDETTNPTGWKQLTITNDGETVTVDGVYYREVAADADSNEFYVLAGNKVSYSADLTNDDMPDGPVTLTFTAYAIQKINGDPTEEDGNYSYFTPAEAYCQARFGISDATVVNSESDITAAVQAANTAGEPAVLALTDSINLESALTITAENGLVLVGDGETITGAPITIKATESIEISGINFNNGISGTQSSIYVSNKDEIENLIIENCSFKDAAWDSIQLTNPNISNITIQNNTFENTKQGYRYIHLELRNSSNGYTTANTKLTITGNTFTNVSTNYCKDSAITICGFSFENMTINNNFVTGDGADNLTSDIIWICDGINFNSLYTTDQLNAAFTYVSVNDADDTQSNTNE